jgi:adenine-specific DNA-methyltransferase
MARGSKKSKPAPKAEAYRHPESESLMRPEVGTQAQFRKKKPPQTYKFDSSLSPALDWDGQNKAREEGEAAIRQILDAKSLDEAKAAAEKLKALSKPFLNWAGKAERLSFDVPTLPLFIHERLSTQAIIETLKGHKRPEAKTLFDFFADPQHSITDQVLRAYEFGDKWVNRMMLGDSLACMNSLLHFESLGGQVQMIYMDPPYGIKYGSNFQPFVRKRDVSHNDDEDFTREPEMVQAYRDTWKIGLHSYLTWLRDRLLLCRDLLAPSGSIFVQISDENLHHVRELMDEVYGHENFVGQINFKSMVALGQKTIAQIYDYILWYAKDIERLKFRRLFQPEDISEDREYRFFDDSKQELGYRKFSEEEFRELSPQERNKAFRRQVLTSSGYTESCTFDFTFRETKCKPFANKSWRTTKEGVETLITKDRLFILGKNPYFKQYYSDFPFVELDNSWPDTTFFESRLYVVQTSPKAIQRCLLMTTDPGDLVFDPTCGSGTTAYVAEQWGRRWITADVSRVPLALARQRLLTATFPWYTLQSDERGPSGGFVYKRKQNSKGEEVGGIVPHVTLKSIANNEPPAEEVLVDRPEETKGITRVTGPFVVEATIPTAMDLDSEHDAQASEQGKENALAGAAGSNEERLLEVLRQSPVLRLAGNKTVTLKNVRPPAKTLVLSAEAMVVNGDEKPVAFVFGPETAAVSERIVSEAAREANLKGYSHLYVIGFAIQPNARQLVDQCEAVAGVPATYVQATPDLLMGDLLKNMRSSQIFSVCGLPEVEIKRQKGKNGDPDAFQVELVGLDVFDPVTMENKSQKGADVPAWFLDTDYNGRCFHVCQAFFPRTGAWDNLKKALKGTHDESVWDHLAGTTSTPFEAGEHWQVAVKVIDDRGNELMVVKALPKNGQQSRQ